MTESDWATSTDPLAMLSFLRDRGPVSERKLRLFAVSCCRLIWPLIDDATSRRAVEVAERFADGLATDRDLIVFSRGRYFEAKTLSNTLSSATAAAGWAVSSPFDVREVELSARHAQDASYFNASTTTDYENEAGAIERMLNGAKEAARREQCDALRDIFGNPFHPVVFSPEWRTEAVVALARGIYEERAWDRMPVLADALEDAGCDCIELLEYCRGPNTHVRGCWLVDLVLGKT
ncbi:hypothetical protein [Urbifossiella limnaea]|uniref:Uncharacterized protein n=1 Tax=Urbifossiella limnaea TaxID=2528023 RepID=A0A517XSV1_9BACT|nr:hypothetical protein [Urbifossiella limnaea]QDU20563.1 hypothetical protein ETAA1_25180 [Urbifossiella limnaea]